VFIIIYVVDADIDKIEENKILDPSACDQYWLYHSKGNA
jgi:hypothetical protein